MGRITRWLEDHAGVLLLSLAPVLIWNVDYHATNQDFSFCLYKVITGHCCYGCGLLRGISALLHGEPGEAFRLNRLNAVTIPLLGCIYGRKWQDALRNDNIKS